MNYLLASVLALVLVGFGGYWSYNASATTHIRNPIQQVFGLTPEGYWVIITNDQQFVSTMCNDQYNVNVYGCARWPSDPEVLPAKHCIIGIYAPDDATQQFIDEVVEHELKHCRIGEYHDEVGIDIPGYEPPKQQNKGRDF